MITFDKIGSFGKLGNQMFQYALLVGVNSKNKCGIVFQKSVLDSLDLFKNFNITIPLYVDSYTDQMFEPYGERFFHFDDSVFTDAHCNSNFVGYFQSSKYFEHCSDQVKSEFTFNSKIYDTAKEYIKLVGQGKEIITIHIRRGDYLSLPEHHPICSKDYYTTAMNLFDNTNSVFIICSDDIEWCKSNFTNKDIVFSNNDTFTDLCIMSLADHNIIANSSFSWWGAWLNSNPSKKVIAPKQWFGPAYSSYITDDIYFEGIVKI